MYEATLNLQTPVTRNNARNQNRNQYVTNNSVHNTQLMSNLSLEIEEGEFVLVGANSLSAKFVPPKPQPQSDFGRMGKKSATSQHTLVRKEENKDDVVMESIFAPLLSAVFPGAHLLEMINHGREAFDKLNDGVNKNITLQETKNINPVDAINPSKAFLPVTPFYAPEKPSPLLWERVRNERASKEEENKKKKPKRMGLGSF